MIELSTTAQVMDALGGNVGVIALTGCKYKAVWNWRKAPKFPANTYRAMIDALHARGFGAPASLWGMKQSAEAGA
jgi:hypothetical protein